MPGNPILLRRSDRAILVGANGTGKSTLANYLLYHVRKDYPDARILVADTKPRWRAEKLTDGTSPKRMYAPLDKGDTIPGAVSLSRMTDWPMAWSRDTNPTQTVILQRLKGSQSANVAFQVAAIERFFATQRAIRPSFLYLDEGMDFFHATSQARGGSDIVQRCFRAGRERGLCTIIAVQRPVGINLQALTETNYCAVFRINYRKDIQRLWEMGWPTDIGPPTYAQKHCFRLWREGSPKAPLFRLNTSSEEKRSA